jgi:4-aminobutyrate aminotransferase-like enzyme
MGSQEQSTITVKQTGQRNNRLDAHPNTPIMSIAAASRLSRAGWRKTTRALSTSVTTRQAVSTPSALTSEKDIAAFMLNSIAKGVGRSTSVVADRGAGVWLHSVDGKQYLDATTGIGVTSTGHSHPAVVKAAQNQVAKIAHVQQNIMFHRPMAELVEGMKETMPDKSLDTFFFWNSGAEAVEAAIKLARHATGKPNVIVVSGSCE